MFYTPANILGQCYIPPKSGNPGIIHTPVKNNAANQYVKIPLQVQPIIISRIFYIYAWVKGLSNYIVW